MILKLDLFSPIVCIKFLTNFAKKLESGDTSDMKKMEEKFRATCKKAKNKENRFVSIIYAHISGLKINFGAWWPVGPVVLIS